MAHRLGLNPSHTKVSKAESMQGKSTGRGTDREHSEGWLPTQSSHVNLEEPLGVSVSAFLFLEEKH